MASMAETLTEKRGGLPTYVWLVIGVGVLAVILYMRKASAAKAAAAAAANTNPALQTNLLSPGAATSLAEGAAPMGFSGGNVYNNVATSATGASAPPTAAPNPYNGEPGFAYQLGTSQILGDVTVGGVTYSFDPLQINGQNVSWQQFATQASAPLKAAGYSISPPTGDFALPTNQYNAALGPAGLTWLNGHSVDSSGNILNTPSPAPVTTTSSFLGNAPTLSATPPYTATPVNSSSASNGATSTAGTGGSGSWNGQSGRQH